MASAGVKSGQQRFSDPARAGIVVAVIYIVVSAVYIVFSDHLVEATGLPVERVLAGLSGLEARGAVRRLSGVTVRLA